MLTIFPSLLCFRDSLWQLPSCLLFTYVQLIQVSIVLKFIINFDRPVIDADATDSDWAMFIDSWERYKTIPK